VTRLDPKRITAVRRRVLRWYSTNGRDLPWRRTSNPYRILISEMMLQQTQVSRVLPKYRQFLRSFPTVRSLSAASPGRVIREWQGLGYNRRALWLHGISRQVVTSYKGRFPRDPATLRSLKGIGEYTVNALLSFAYRQPVAVVDVNVKRVLSRIFGLSPDHVTQEVASACLAPQRAYEWNQALMDIGSLYCTASVPKCDACPLARSCSSCGLIREPQQTRTRPEPSRHGIPRRIYRGRILREVTRRSKVTERSLARSVGLSSTAADVEWLRSLAETLAREGLITFSPTRTSWTVRRKR